MSGEPVGRRLILYMSMSLDGFAARADGVIDWLGRAQTYDDHRQRAVAELLGQAGLLVLGGRAGQDMAKGRPGSTSPTGEFMNALPKVVFSSRLTDLAWNNARVSGRPAEEEIPELKSRPGKDLVAFGGASFARSLASHGLIDEYRINVHPVVLGDGLPLLSGLEQPQPLKLVSSTTWSDGPITQTYVVHRTTNSERTL